MIMNHVPISAISIMHAIYTYYYIGITTYIGSVLIVHHILIRLCYRTFYSLNLVMLQYI